MFKHRTVFVLGAGSSAEVGLPIGSKLALGIRDMLDVRYDDFGRRQTSGDRDLFSQIERAFPDEVQAHQRACWLIRDGILLSNSIDDFLNVHAADPRVLLTGKAAIVKSILAAERASDLMFDRSNSYNTMDFRKLAGSWFIKFMRMLGRGLPLHRKEDVFANVGFVVFNYDRCLEYFLLHALRAHYNINENDAAELLKTAKIVHPYGAVGTLPLSGLNGIPFGGPDHGHHPPYLELANRIRTYTEQMQDQTELNETKALVEQAEVIVFLGFAYYDQNVELLRPHTPFANRKRIWGTAFGLSKNDADIISEQLTDFFGNHARLTMGGKIVINTDFKCTDVFDFYNKSLPA